MQRHAPDQIVRKRPLRRTFWFGAECVGCSRVRMINKGVTEGKFDFEDFRLGALDLGVEMGREVFARFASLVDGLRVRPIEEGDGLKVRNTGYAYVLGVGITDGRHQTGLLGIALLSAYLCTNYMDIFIGLLLVALFIALNGFFVAAEFAIVKIRGSQLGELLKRNDVRAKELEEILANLDRYLSATQVGITLISLALGWLGEPVMTALISPFFDWVAPNTDISHTISAILGFILLTSVHIVLGELLPKSIAINFEKRVALGVTRPLRLFYSFFRYPIRVLNLAFVGISKLIGLPTTISGEAQTEEELRHAILDSAKRGVVSESESKMIESVFEFGETEIREVMVHRSDVIGLDVEAEPRELFRIIETEGFSRLPVFRGSLDEVLGVLYVKDLLPYFSQLERLTIPSQNASAEFVKLLERVMRQAKYVSETQPISELLREFRRSRTHMAIVVSEHGGVEGLVTLEDILEELVGEIQDESDVPADERSVIEVGDAIYLDPSMSVADFNDRFASRFPSIEESPDYQTISGFIQKECGKIPNVGDVIDSSGMRFIVKRKIRHRLEQVKIERTAPMIEIA